MSDARREDGAITRLSFIKAAGGVAAGVGAAAIGVPGAAAKVAGEGGVQTEPSSPAPPEPVVAYVRDAGRGEVTVVRGTEEATYRDKALVRRLLAAAPSSRGRAGE